MTQDLIIETKEFGNLVFDKGDMVCKKQENGESAYYCMTENKLILMWKSSDSVNLISYDELKLSQDKIDRLTRRFVKSIENRLTVDKYDPMIENNMWIINLEKRKDRKIKIRNQTNTQDTFNVYFFRAIDHYIGSRGCTMSHLALIAYAKIKKLPHAIVAEDDNLIKDIKKLSQLIKRLLQRNDWEIFNASPSFYDIMCSGKQLVLYGMNGETELVKCNWGQTTNFMIYNNKSYDLMLDHKFEQQIDQYIPSHFQQVIYRNGYTCIQYPSISNIGASDKISDFSSLYTKFESMLSRTKVTMK